MPIYEYRCAGCEQLIEVLQKYSDAPLTTCASCGGKLERLISPPGLHFKGSGWYVTDYARAGAKGSDSKSGGDTKPDSKSDSKSESKPAKPAVTSTKSDG